MLNILISDIYTSSSDKLLNCAEYLKATAEDFDSAEEYIKNPTKKEWKSLVTVQLHTSDRFNQIKNTTSKVFEELGFGGTLVSWVINSDSRENFFKSMLKVGEKGVKVWANMVDGKSVNLFELYKTVDAIGLRENLAVQTDKYIINNIYNSVNSTVAQKNASNLAATIKWMGVAVSGMINFKNNADEYNYDFKNPHMWVETGLETALDVGKGIALKALAGAVLGPGAPVFAVGLAAVAATTVLDAGCKFFFDKGLTEAVSDAAIWVAEKGIEYGKKVVEKAGTAVRKAGEAVAKAVKTTAANVGNAVKKAGQAVAKTVEKAGQAVSKAVEKTKQAVSNTVSKVASTAKTIANNAVKTVGNAVKSAKNTVKAAWNGITKIGKGLSGLFA